MAQLDKIHEAVKNALIKIETDLLYENVPKEDIVPAFQEPSMRKYNEFAIA